MVRRGPSWFGQEGASGLLPWKQDGCAFLAMRLDTRGRSDLDLLLGSFPFYHR
jgi:hypothetical protein